MGKIHEVEDFTWQVSKLMPGNKTAPKGALCLKVKVKGLGETGMLVTSNCTIEQYERAAKMLRYDMHKRTNEPTELAPQFIQEIETIQELSKWKKFIKFIKKIFRL